MSRYFTNVKNNIEERVNTSYIDELYTKDTQGEFRKIVAGESGGGDIELPTYLKEETIEFDRAAVGADSIITKAPTMYTKMTSSALITGLGSNTSSTASQTRLIWNGIRIYGTSGGLGAYKENEIQYINGDDTKSFTIVDAEKVVNGLKDVEYIKPDKIEILGAGGNTEVAAFKTTSGGGTIFTPYKIKITGANVPNTNDVVLDRTQLLFQEQPDNYTRITAAGSIIKKTPEDLKSFTILNAEKVVNNLKDLTSTAAQIDAAVANSGGGSVPGYIQPNKIEFTDVSSGDQLISLNATTNHQSYIMPTAMRVRLNKNTDIYTDTSTQLYNSFTIYSGAINKYTTFRDKEIQTNDGTGSAKTLNLPNIADAQANYLKSNKIEFADGSGLSADGLSYKEGSTTITKTIKEVLDAVDNSGGGGIDYDYLEDDGIRTTGTQSITHKINPSDSLNRYSLTTNRIHHQSRVAVGNNPSSGLRTEIQPDRIYLYEESGQFSGFYKDHIRYLKGGEVKSLNYDDVNKTMDKVNKGYIKTSFWSSRGTSKIFWIGKYEKALETSQGFPSSSIIQFTEHAVRNSGKLLFRMWYSEHTCSAGEIIKFIFRVQKPEGSSLVNKYAIITADICDVPRSTPASLYLGAPFEVVSVGPSHYGEDVEDSGAINFDTEYFAYYTLQLRALKSIGVGELDFTMMLQFHGYLGDFGTMPTSMYVTT